jgi:hypothetical protein
LLLEERKDLMSSSRRNLNHWAKSFGSYSIKQEQTVLNRINELHIVHDYIFEPRFHKK